MHRLLKELEMLVNEWLELLEQSGVEGVPECFKIVITNPVWYKVSKMVLHTSCWSTGVWEFGDPC